ncbi:hypothetical protein NIES4073_31740 [Kalymmatonema gypsitolerans NIES-4073]|jgi:hypothetical protein|uniref:hypothetical protein n=1 Tax=Scytonema sp. PCC 10023 TaxID=1680591 RepID=UPI000B5F2EE7|nr:hypothetical protein NIES4073_31740 [Scytonema sp. NIES-4073]
MPVQTKVDITIDSNDSSNGGIETSVDNFDSNLPQSGKRLGSLYNDSTALRLIDV